MAWHQANEGYLVNRRPLATVGVVWSQRNTDFFGRDQAEELVELPYRGVTEALIRARIPYQPVHAEHIARDAAGLAVLILPNLGAMSDDQCAAVRRFVEGGGALLATGATSLYTGLGDPRPDFGLAPLYGAHRAPGDRPSASSRHTYLRIDRRHDVLKGFEETDILPFGGLLGPLRMDPGAEVPLTFIPEFPVYPPETAWMRELKSDIPALVLRNRVAYLAADLDRQYARHHLPDHARLLANLVRWLAGDRIPLRVEGPGLIDCLLYQQPGRAVLHLVNLSNPDAWRAPLEELIPIGPLRVQVRLPAGVSGRSVKLLVSGEGKTLSPAQGWTSFEVKSVLDHEVAVVA
jgi:hypothetical protein